MIVGTAQTFNYIDSMGFVEDIYSQQILNRSADGRTPVVLFITKSIPSETEKEFLRQRKQFINSVLPGTIISNKYQNSL